MVVLRFETEIDKDESEPAEYFILASFNILLLKIDFTEWKFLKNIEIKNIYGECESSKQPLQ